MVGESTAAEILREEAAQLDDTSAQDGPYGIILAPSRELVIQIEEEAEFRRCNPDIFMVSPPRRDMKGPTSWVHVDARHSTRVFHWVFFSGC